MNKYELQNLNRELQNVAKELQQAVNDLHGYEEDVIVAKCDACVRRRRFDNERGRLVTWDGSLWWLGEWEDVIFPLGHSRGARTVVEEGDPENGDITLACLEPY